MYRVYDKKETTWVKENIYLAPNNDLYLAKKNLLGNMTLSLISDNRYVYQIDTGLLDKNKQLIFEGDICKAIQSGMVGLISYSSDYGAYVFLDYYTQNNIGLAKNIVDVASTCIMIRDVFEDEYTDEKRALKVYRLEGKNGKSKIPVKLDKNKRYQVFFIVKNQEGAANQFQIVAEHDKSRNIINEVGITNISPDGF